MKRNKMTKSPVYGQGRNYKHSKSWPKAAAGNVKMKGKKFRVMGCRCCVCKDFRESELKKEHQKEINGAVAQSGRAVE